MIRKCLQFSIVAVVGSTLGFLNTNAVAETKIGQISGRVNAQYVTKQVQSTKDDTRTTEGGIFTDARLGWKSSFRQDTWKGGAKLELDIQEYGAGVSKTSDSSKFLITHRDKYVYLQNSVVKILLGYAWDHLNGGVQGGEYFNYLYASVQNSAKHRGVHASRVEALALSLRTFDDIDLKLILGQGSDGNGNWHNVSSTKQTDDLGVGLAFKMTHELFKLSSTIYKATSKGNKDRDPNSDGYSLETGMMAVGFQWYNLISDLNPFINYQIKTAKDDTAKTGDGFTRLEIGFDYELNDSSGITCAFNSNTDDNEDSDTNETDETIALSYMIKIANVRVGAGFSRENHITKSDAWNKENRLGANLLYYF